MIERNLENCIIGLIKSALSSFGDKVRVVGSWQTLEEEGSKEAVVVAVAVAPRAYSTHSIPYCDFSVSVAVAGRSELFESGEEMSDFVSPIVELLDTWQFDIEQFSSDASLAGEFVAAGVRLDGGGAPAIDAASGIITAVQNFTVRGHVVRGEQQEG